MNTCYKPGSNLKATGGQPSSLHAELTLYVRQTQKQWNCTSHTLQSCWCTFIKLIGEQITLNVERVKCSRVSMVTCSKLTHQRALAQDNFVVWTRVLTADGKGQRGNIIPAALLQIRCYQRGANREITPRMHPDKQPALFQQ